MFGKRPHHVKEKHEEMAFYTVNNERARIQLKFGVFPFFFSTAEKQRGGKVKHPVFWPKS